MAADSLPDPLCVSHARHLLRVCSQSDHAQPTSSHLRHVSICCRVPDDPLVILPLMVGTYILFGGVASGIYFEEFGTVHEGPAGASSWVLYLLGMLLVFVGLGLIADPSFKHHAARVTPMEADGRTHVAATHADGEWADGQGKCNASDPKSTREETMLDCEPTKRKDGYETPTVPPTPISEVCAHTMDSEVCIWPQMNERSLSWAVNRKPGTGKYPGRD